MRYNPHGKRLLDVVVAAALLVLLAPAFALIALLVRAEDGGPVLFRHRRIGRGGRSFDCLKFRTMRNDAPQMLEQWRTSNSPEWQEFSRCHKLRNDPRVLRIGRFLRRTSLDELPQLWNVLKGEMSLVGPRPVTAEELDIYDAYGALELYLDAVPGLTGLWQTSTRSDSTYAERISFDQRYAGTSSLRQDVRVLALTALVPFRQTGAY